jgi:hypothetical protein
MVDRVRHVSEDIHFANLHQLTELISFAGVDTTTLQRYEAGNCSTKEAFCRTIMGDIIIRGLQGEVSESYDRDITEEHQDIFWEFWDRKREDEGPEQIFESFLNPRFVDIAGSIALGIENRVFFTTNEGLFGTAGPKVQPGDEIWIVKGGFRPLILRKVESENLDHYTFVSDCYVHGIMDGEQAPEEADKWQELFLV